MPAIELHPAIRNLPELYTMIRSTPPASSHFADIPVPAPAPMIGRPAAILAAEPFQDVRPRVHHRRLLIVKNEAAES